MVLRTDLTNKKQSQIREKVMSLDQTVAEHIIHDFRTVSIFFLEQPSSSPFMPLKVVKIRDIS